MKKNLLYLLVCMIPSFLSAQELKDEFKPSGKLVSQVFGDYFYVVKADTGILDMQKTVLNKKTNENGFRFRRANIGYEYNFAKNLTSMIRLETEETSLTPDAKMGFFLKDAFVKWNLTSKTDLLIGLQSTFAFEESEKTWGHRFIEKPIMDLRSAVSSRDFGLSVRGKITDDGSLFYNVMVANSSLLKTETDKYKRFYANIGFRPVNSICITAYGDYSVKERKNSESKNEIIWGLFAGIIKEKFTAGLEGYYKITQNSYISGSNTVDLHTLGSSAFGTYKIAKKWGSFIRVDFWDLNIDLSEDSRNYAVAGITWTPINNFTISPNAQVEIYEPETNHSYDPSIWARLTFHWLIK